MASKKLYLKDVRLSFDVLGKAEDYQGNGVFRRSATFLVPCDDPQKAMVDKVLIELAKEEWKDKGPFHLDNILVDPKGCCWVDGKRKSYDGYAGNFALTAHRKEADGRPIVMDNDRSPIYQPDDSFYPGKAGRLFGGCYVDCEVKVWTQDNKNGKGMRCELLVIQRRRKGDSFGGGSVPTADAFGSIEDGADAEDLT